METLEYIDAYFQKTLTDDERRNFETRCAEEEAFAREVAVYVSARTMLSEELFQKKTQEWNEGEEGRETASVVPIKKITSYKWIRYAAAACLVLALATYLFEKPRSTQWVANNYITTHYTSLSQTMGTGEDSMELAKAAFNNKEYDKALALLGEIQKSHPQNSEALKYTGIVYLVTDRYDKALAAFETLSKTEGLFSNPGMFLKAITLMKRDSKSDKMQAKAILEQVVEQNLEGSQEAKDWLKKF